MSIKLDKATMREWKEVQYAADLPTLNEFLEFLKSKADCCNLLNSHMKVHLILMIKVINIINHENSTQ